MGMSVANYLIVLSKEHINSFAEFSKSEIDRLENLIDSICSQYLKVLGIFPCIFEHGSLINGRHPLSIVHAHIHIIPIELELKNTIKLFKDLKLKKKENYYSIKTLQNKDYWVYRSNQREYYMSHSVKDAPRSSFINIVASQVGYEMNYEWRDKKITERKMYKLLLTILSVSRLLYYRYCTSIN